MTTTQVVDVYNHTPMDTPKDESLITIGAALKYLGYITLTILGFIAVWVGKGILNYFKNQFGKEILEIKEAAQSMKTVLDDLKIIRGEIDKLKVNDAEILNRMKRIDDDIDYIKKHLKL